MIWKCSIIPKKKTMTDMAMLSLKDFLFNDEMTKIKL